jgi:tetratricopeptide (TPR) repeat protein
MRDHLDIGAIWEGIKNLSSSNAGFLLNWLSYVVELINPSQKLQPSRFYKNDPAGKNAKLVVFVHGVFGSAITTWGDPATEMYWPAMIAADGRFVDYDIYLLNYHTPYLKNAPNIHETAGIELSHLKDLGIFKRYTDIHFIAHSMGGLVVKSMLTRLNSGSEGSMLRQVKSVVFLSTPAQGASIAGFGSWFLLNPQLKDMERAHLNTYIQSLEDTWVTLITDRDMAKVRFPRVHCAYETQETFGVLVVPREMANTRCDGTLQPLPFHHHGVAIPTSRDTDPYLWVMARVLEVNEEAKMRRNADDLLAQAARLRLSNDYERSRAAYRDAHGLYKAVEHRLGEADVLRGLGDLERMLGRNDQTRAAYTEARALYKAVEHRLGEANVLLGLGGLERTLSRYDQARTAYTEARALYKAVGDRLGEANVILGLGDLERMLGRNDQARTAYTEARALYKAVGDRHGEANVLLGLGDLERTLGRKDQARAAYTEARALYKAVGDRFGEANMLLDLGELERTLGCKDHARAAYTDARALYKAVEDRLGEANVLLGLGELERMLGRNDQARAAYTEARVLYKAVEDRLGEANVFKGLGGLEYMLGRNDQARAAYTEARALYKAVEDRLGEANVLRVLGRIESTSNPGLARQYLFQAAGLFDAIGNRELHEIVLNEARQVPH